MANGALGAPRLPGPQGVARPELTASSIGAGALIRDSGGRWSDPLFKYAMLACGLAVLALVGLIIYELAGKSQLAWHAFGWKFFVGQD